MKIIRSGSIVLALFAGLLTTAHAKEELLDLASRSGVTSKVILTFEPDAKPAFIAVILPGGRGDFQFKSGGSGITMINEARLPNPLRALLLQRGIPSLLVDAPSDLPELTDDFRLSANHAEDLKTVIAVAEKRFPGVPIVVVGHSSGSLSAANLSGEAATQIRGTVFVAGRFVARPRPAHLTFINLDGLTKYDWGKIKKPVLLIHHKKDDCYFTPHIGSADLSAAKGYELQTLDPEGSTANGQCTYTGTHNLAGLEVVVADSIVSWGKKQSGK